MHGGSGVDFLNGSDGDDVLYGDSGNDYLSGDDGADTIYGGTGNDHLYAGSDKYVDKLFAGAGDDDIYADADEDEWDFGPDDFVDKTDHTGEDWAFALRCGFLFPIGCAPTVDSGAYPDADYDEFHDWD